jgi:hypothetical protein
MKPGPAISTFANQLIGGQRSDQLFGQVARFGACRFGQQHGGVAGEIAVFAASGALDHEIRRFDALRQGAIA